MGSAGYRYHPFSSKLEKDGVIRVYDFQQACIMPRAYRAAGGGKRACNFHMAIYRGQNAGGY